MNLVKDFYFMIKFNCINFTFLDQGPCGRYNFRFAYADLLCESTCHDSCMLITLIKFSLFVAACA